MRLWYVPRFERYPALWAAGIEHMRTQASPMEPDNGVKLIFVTVIGLIMIMTDLLVSGDRSSGLGHRSAGHAVPGARTRPGH